MASRNIIITGAASGMAKAQTEAFLEQGDTVFGFDFNEQGLKQEEQNAGAFKGSFYGYKVDISSKIQIDNALKNVWEKVDRIDVLINTAGIFDKYQKFLETTEEMWDAVLNTNLKGMFLLTQAVTAKMIKNGGGNVINVASVAGLQQDGGGVAYTVAKHGVIGLTKKISYELGTQGIRVNAIAPGRITTNMNNNTSDLIVDNLPAQRNGKVEDIVNATLFLASDKSSYIHGQVITVDGGWTVV
ncbi:SDR family NAD(P)-dependent oxidoreductase [Ligilactobacillus pobuzihii]|uniref:3-ketoacyl-(Acyl-carrier-protein) reductase n=1 Tax=Ligilactobacillus pobuzihii TaxID=449659 RepID=A0A0R2L9P0_9LACO|nr:SDR family oxidoreductase [Ligilactobacillus pobuzihii]KRK09344.1 3-ketoacyl-(acyl-carrier-protein) reductase [Ligilactobacillus pobuzihii E100301 = KCTC 13174]KRN98514.1 3-ketoacyl-(acyl-carrier-protein) reductase [Ligilactobacillus pobuzihii]GEN48540.1 NAD(P)-dependent dehydrogenase [Ligilactobacillus pobuzihii]